MTDARAILNRVLDSHQDAEKWIGQSFERIKILSNTKVGDVGQDFVEALCEEIGFNCEFPLNKAGRRARQSPWDIRIEQVDCELKTATEDVQGAFQFNHLRYHRPYHAVICIGISPNDIYIGAWTKAEITTGQAGTLVTMEKGANASYKLTKKPADLAPISEFETRLLDVITKLEERGEQ